MTKIETNFYSPITQTLEAPQSTHPHGAYQAQKTLPRPNFTPLSLPYFNIQAKLLSPEHFYACSQAVAQVSESLTFGNKNRSSENHPRRPRKKKKRSTKLAVSKLIFSKDEKNKKKSNRLLLKKNPKRRSKQLFSIYEKIIKL